MKTIELDKQNRKTKISNYGKIPEKPNEEILRLAAPHLDSFNFFLEEGLQTIRNIPPVEFSLQNGEKISFQVQDVDIEKPQIKATLEKVLDRKIYPKECIEAGSTYQAPLTLTVSCMVNQIMQPPIILSCGEIPIMVKSKTCNLYGMNPEELVRHGELVNETGGYFIINGGCRILRLLTANRRNYPIALIRKSWKMRDANFTEKGILIRCVNEEESVSINVLHHLITGGVKLEIQLGREVFLLPLILVLKALMDYSDRLIYLSLIRGRETDTYFSEKVKMMMRELQLQKLYTREMCQSYIGNIFRTKLQKTLPIWTADDEICHFLFDSLLLIHLDNQKIKFETLCMMTRKLFAFVAGDCASESVDVLSLQEVSLGGHTYLNMLREMVADGLRFAKVMLTSKNMEKGDSLQAGDVNMRSAFGKARRIGDVMKTFVATGSLPRGISCGIMQKTGLTVLLEHLNRQRDLSHLRAIHRGAYFINMKTIGPRRLTGEAWGFICPVHTPDGAPCGLLNHLTYRCVVPCETGKTKSLTKALLELGMTPVETAALRPSNECLEVILDGGLVGYITNEMTQEFAHCLRALKIQKKIYEYTEIVLIEKKKIKGLYPALFLSTTPSRMMRPVLNLDFQAVEYIGSLEQLYMNIAISHEDFDKDVHNYMELEKISMLSNIARMVPFSDCNPTPRNMYQCQMGKQTMGTPLHNWMSQTNNKVYRLQYPQLPLVRNSHYDEINMDEFCMGFNAVLAIVSYTGYDMEDAVVINKCAMERGLGHGQVYKSEFINLLNEKGRSKSDSQVTYLFKRDPSNAELADFLDENGLPYPGTKLSTGNPYYCTYEIDLLKYRVVQYKGEDCVVDKYSIINSDSTKNTAIQKVNITLRVRRDPIIGDKFASRSGQKGVMSILHPMEDLPFSERGITPDIIFNPHGIPSRMTAGTLIEVLAGKCAAEFGKAFDSSPFEFNDENPAYDYYGKILEKAGFNCYGEDVLYSGTDGRMMEVQIYEGVVYYQRLRHMTADKWQVRSTGPMDTITHQPIKGRKKGGAIRFGEMERDCLIAHGAAFALKDRLLDCSDASDEWVCSECGSILSPTCDNTKLFLKTPECRICGPEGEVRQIRIPYGFKYLVAELASVGIKTDLGSKSTGQKLNPKSYPNIKTEISLDT